MKNLNLSGQTRWLRGVALAISNAKMRVNPRMTPTSTACDLGFTLLRMCAVFCILFTIGVGNVWGDYTITFKTSGTTSLINTGGDYATSTETAYVEGKSSGVQFGSGSKGGNIVLTMTASGQVKASKITLNGYCKLASKGGDCKVTITFTDNSTENHTPSATTTATATDVTITNSNKTLKSIKLESTDAEKRFYVTGVTVVATASCDANPTIGTASLNGSFSLSSVPLSCSVSSAGGDGCSITEAGFVWKAGGAPSTTDNKTTGTYSTNITGNITGTFSTGTTYYIKAYATNGHGTTYSSTSFQLTPRSITFNSNGGSSVSTIYVNSGTAATAPTAPTKTGYDFGGWYQESTLENAVNWSNTISENKTYYAKWTAKTTTVSFNQNSGTGGQTTTKTATYGQAMPTPITTPTREGYDFGGYYDGSGGTGTQYYIETGASARNWDKEAATATLYAKWTIKTYTVTWMVNNTIYSAGGSTSVNHGSRVSTLPTAPDPASYCGDKFVGWTTDAAYVHGTSPLFTTAGSAPTASGTQTFYAVFADYAE